MSASLSEAMSVLLFPATQYLITLSMKSSTLKVALLWVADDWFTSMREVVFPKSVGAAGGVVVLMSGA